MGKSQKPASFADQQARMDEQNRISSIRADKIASIIYRRLNVNDTANTLDALTSLIFNYEYKASFIVESNDLQDKDIANIIISVYPKDASLHTDSLDALFAGTKTEEKTRKVSVRTVDKEKRIPIEYKLPAEVLLKFRNSTDRDVEASIVEFLKANKWRDYTCSQILSLLAPDYASKIYTARKSGNALSAFARLLENTVDSKSIIKYEKKADGKKVYVHYKYCPEKTNLNAAVNEQWLNWLCKIINMALEEFREPLTESEVYTLVKLYCGSMRKEKIWQALEFMVAVGHLKMEEGADSKVYYNIDPHRNVKKEELLKKQLYRQYK